MPRSPTSVLLIEDDEEDFMITEDLLDEASGTYELIWVTNQDEALAQLREHDFDVCLIDFRLGAETGLEVLLAARAKNAMLPFIFLTGLADEEVDRAAMEAGAADYLVKSGLTAGTLDRAIRYACTQSRTLRSLRDSEERNRSLVEAATDGIALLDSGGNIVGTNPALATIFGVTEYELSGTPLSELISDLPVLAPNAAVVIRNVLLSARSVDGLVPVELSLAPWQSAGEWFWTAIVRDITERQEMANKLSHQAYHDTVTGLANRLKFSQHLSQNLSRAQRQESIACLVFLDLDDFKRINDSHGHAVGDLLLQEVGLRLRSCTREHDLVARFGGDEFAICADYPAGDSAEGIRLAARVVQLLAEPFHIGTLRLDVTCSVGVALDAGTGVDPEVFATYADVAMYRAKDNGKNTFAVFEGAMHERLLERIALDNDYGPGLDREEFVLVYQPLIELATQNVLGFEGLCRWDHPVRGRLSPDQFIPLVEESGRIDGLGSYVIGQACRDAIRFSKVSNSDPYVTVNVSPRQLASIEVVDSVYNALADTGLDPNRFVLEITESAMMLDFDVALKHLHALKELDVRLALDDFGSGFSSLNLLHRLPLDILKLDRLFIADINKDDGAAHIVRTIAAMCSSLGITALAEGVETREDHDFIFSAGFDMGQGYFYARPADFDKAATYLDAGHTHRFLRNDAA